ncbi:MAG: Gfo/Idh/MocA family oxidoreductase [Lentisphaeria bacterium]|nr:Gfo/Idh/MocA family oxidoreductase [Lentisphaeria bacterium]
MTKKRYAVVGTGGRSDMYICALAGGDYKDYAELVAFCDVNQGRMDYYNERIGKKYNHAPVPTYLSQDFDRMIEECRPDTVIVTTMDRTHHKYGCRAMELGCDVISEKPMTVDAEKCQQIIDTQKKTGKHYTVTFNYRYSPRNTKIKELLKSGICGQITSVNFEWLLDTSHGADYFRRWHRCKRNSGGLMVHKATHHFDLVNWWLDSVPVTVYAMGDLKFYGRENAEKRGVTEFYQRSLGSEIARKDPFGFRLDKDYTEFLQRLYFDSEKYDGYQRDQSVFGDGIDIEDNMSVMVRYKNNVVMNYTLCAHCPYEGYRICFNGTKGRLEFYVIERGVTQLDEDFSTFGNREEGETPDQDLDRKKMAPEIIFQPFWGKPVVYTYDKSAKGGHGGGDVRLMNNLFIGVKDDPFGHAADFTDGAMSILTGIGANISMRTGEPVKVQELIHF